MPSKKSPKDQRFLAIFSEVNSSPQLLAILLEAKQSGFLVSALVFCQEGNSLLENLSRHGIFAQQVKPRRKLHSGGLFFTVGRNIFRRRPDIVFTSGIYANVIGLTISYLLRIDRRIFIRHHSNYHSRSGNHFGTFVDRFCSFLATEMVAVSKLVQRILLEVEKVPKAKVRLIHNGIDLSLFKLKNMTSPTIFDAKPNVEFKIGLVSRITSLKGIEYAASAFAKLHNEFPFAKFTVVGKFADSFSDVKKILSELPVSNYQLLESVPSIPKFLSELDVFVHVPIGPEDESFGLVYIEALAMNVNCIFTISGVLNELPELEKYVSVVDYKSSDGIYRCLYNLISKEVGPKPAVPDTWLNQFDLEEMAKSYVQMFVSQKKLNE